MTYLIQHAGAVRVTRWAKRHWNDAPDKVRRTVLGYISAQWDLVDFKVGRHDATAELEQHLTRADNDSPGWHHAKTLTIELRSGRITNIRNAKSFTTAPSSTR